MEAQDQEAATEAGRVSDPRCAYCGGADYMVVQRFPEPEAEAVRCACCKLVRTLPYPVFNYAADDSYASAYIGEAREQLFGRFMAQFMDFVTRYSTGAQLLDVGSGMGFLLDEAARRGFVAQGIEINRRELDMTRARGLKVHEGTLESLQLPSAGFDVVCMSHVLEHVQDLASLVDEVHRVLKPGGLLTVSQPHYAAPLVRVLGPRWYGWAPDGHVWHFDVPALTRVLAGHGFDRVGVAYNSLFYPWIPQKSLRWNPRRVVAYAGVAAVARVEAWFGRGDQFYLAARRRG